ncbi:ribosomal RNA-processing protein 7 homolog A isoform X1 [Chironomus tepperi]|uniref:ribosomal RNA-processing protein 7 homolog A isoform X1 n=1 Tax=Chironomus tepperi TaxID=113505 RepID=UPI00391F59FF
MTSEEISEFKVLKLRFSENDEKDAHQIFMKKYRSDKKSSNKPAGKTLLVLNIPPYVTKESLMDVFNVIEDVDTITLIDDYSNEHKTKYNIPSKFFNDKIPFKFLIGFVVFKKSSSLDTILTLSDLPPMNETPAGIEKWTVEHNKKIININDMQSEIDEYMKHFDKIVDNNQDNTEADEDGWIQVGKKGHYAGFKQSETVVHRLEEKLQYQRKKAKKNLQQISGIYAFEARENKKQELIELRKKFEEDKSKLQAMKQNRKFKPY